MMKKHSAVYPGTFDPITIGHLDIIKRSLKIFDNIIVGISENHSKNTFFTLEQRVKITKDALKDVFSEQDQKRVTVLSYKSILVEFLQDIKVYNLVRGIRAFSDFDFELNLALANLSLEQKIETIFLPAMPEYQHISSSLIRDLIGYKSNKLDSFVSPAVAQYIKNLYSQDS